MAVNKQMDHETQKKNLSKSKPSASMNAFQNAKNCIILSLLPKPETETKKKLGPS